MNERRAVPLAASSDIVAARHASRELARQLGFGPADQTRLATPVSEIAPDAIQYAAGGVRVITAEPNCDGNIIRVVVEDHGPGIADLDTALDPSGGLETGLPAARSLVC